MTITTQEQEVLRAQLNFIYDGDSSILTPLLKLLADFKEQHPQLSKKTNEQLSERDAMLISYGDQISREGEAPLNTLHHFLNEYLKDAVNAIHLLPFYPYSSDDGFSVIDYLQVDPQLGSWADISAIGQDFRLMFDAVINHISAKSSWFAGFLQDQAPYRDYFISTKPDTDLSAVVRPRTTPLLTPFVTISGVKHVWTTFSADQIDLNYANAELLLEITKVLLDYVVKGAEIIRLDAVTYLWKEIGTTCVHHPKTHCVLQLFRSVMDSVAPNVVLLTETNVPHQENISYFGDGHNEAQMVYNFALPPLVLHSFLAENASQLSRWTAELSSPSQHTTFFNFLASHDGIGVRPVEGILNPEQILNLAKSAEERGGFVSYKTNSDGSESPYELNISLFDALNNPYSNESLAQQVARFMAAQAIMLSLAGVPGIYVHSLLGSRSYRQGVVETGQKRSINRQKFAAEMLRSELDDPNSLRHQVLSAYKRFLLIRRKEAAFHPQAAQEVLAGPEAVFALKRSSQNQQEVIYCLHNVSNQAQIITLENVAAATLRDLLSTELIAHQPGEDLKVALEPYQVCWLKPQ